MNIYKVQIFRLVISLNTNLSLAIDAGLFIEKEINMRKWKRIKTSSGIEYISNLNEKIIKYDKVKPYAPVGSNIAYKYRREKYYYSPQIRHGKFYTLKEIKEYFEKNVEPCD